MAASESTPPHFIARPARPAQSGVVVVMEGNGISPQLLRVCQRLAAEGHTAIAPDLYHRFGGSDPEAWEQQFGARRDEDSLADLAACVALLRREGAGRVGITGFCMGGRLTYLAAVSGLDVQAAAPFYGGGIAEILGRPACPVLAFFGGADAYVPMSDIERIQAHHRDDAGVEIVVYPGAPHGFMRDGSADHEPEAATDAWARLTAFLSKHL